MKKFTLFTFLLLISMTHSFAQGIPNGSFETWTNYPSGSYPTGWTTSDSVGMGALCGGVHNAVQAITPVCDGSYSIKLTTWTCLGQIIPGTVTNGTIAVGLSGVAISGGTPHAVRNDSLTGCFEYTPSGSGNIAVISAVMYKRNGANRDTIAYAIMALTSASSMAPFSIPFIYKDVDPSHIPDSILVVCSSSSVVGAPSVAGSILYVDNLKLKGTFNNIQTPPAFQNVNVYPSPVTGDVLNIDVTIGQYKNSTYTIFDGLGRVAKTGSLKEKQSLDVTQLANGMYTLTLNAASGEQLYSTRVSLNR